MTTMIDTNKKYIVSVPFELYIDVPVEAANVDEARAKAQQAFEGLTYHEYPKLLSKYDYWLEDLDKETVVDEMLPNGDRVIVLDTNGDDVL